MERESIRSALIDTFLQAINQKNSKEAVSILTMIGIETVLTEVQKRGDNTFEENQLMGEIEVIKGQLDQLNQQCENMDKQKNRKVKKSPTQKHQQREEEQQTAVRKSQRSQWDYYQAIKTKNKELTPKVTQSKITSSISPATQKNNKYFRHHLDDQQMKDALSQDNYQQVTEPNKNQRKKNQKTFPQSIQYFLDMRTDSVQTEKDDNFNPQQNHMQYPTYTSCQLEDNHRRMMQQYVEELENSQQQQEDQNQQYTQTQYPDPQPKEQKRLEQVEAYDNQPKVVAYAYNQERQVTDKDMYESCNNRPKPITGNTNYSPYFHNQKLKTESSQVSKIRGNFNMLDIANSLLNSPIIRQVSIQQSDSSSIEKYQENVHHYLNQQSCLSYQRDDIHVSRFEPIPFPNQSDCNSIDQRSQQIKQIEIQDSQISQASNSSAFSLFKPNEELRSFFHTEFVQNFQESLQGLVQDPLNNQSHEVLKERSVNQGFQCHVQQKGENVNPNLQQKISNVFVKGRLGGSKVF